MTPRIAITSSLVLAAMLVLPTSLTSAKLTGACLKDAKAQCAGVQPGGGKIRECLKTHIKDLSDDCKAVLLKAVNVKVCAADVKQFCADTKPGEGRVEACMKAHIADVSDACKVAMANEAARRMYRRHYRPHYYGH
jgi:cysteine rich repeat protein